MPDLTQTDNLLAGYQGAVDKMYDIPVPQHISEDADALQSEYLKPIKDLREQAVNSFSSGNSIEGLRAVRALDRFVTEAKQPGGVYTGFESRYSERQKQIEEVNKMLTEKERMDIAPYINTRLGYRAFRGDKGTIQSLGPANYSMVLAAGEMDKWINEQLPMIKETLISEGLAGKYNMDQFTDLWQMRRVMGVDFNRVINVLASRMPDQYKNSIRQEYMKEKMYDPSLPDLTNDTDPARIFEFDKNGDPKKDKYGNYVIANTPLGKILQGAAYGYQHTEASSQYIKNTDELRLHGAKKKLEEDMDKMATMRTAVYNTGIELPKVEFKDGKVKVGTYSQRTGGYGPAFMEATPSVKSFDTYKKPTDYFNSDDFRNENPVGAGVWDRIKDKAASENWSDDRIQVEFNKLYGDVQAKMSVADFRYQAYVDPKEVDMQTKLIVGDGKGAGNIVNSTIYMMKPGEAPKPMSYGEFVKEYGKSKIFNDKKTSQEYINESSRILGEIEAGTGTLPEGKLMSYTVDKGTKDEQQVMLIVTDIPLEDVQRNMPQYILSEPSFNHGKEKSDIVRGIGISVSDQAPEGVKQMVNTLNGNIYSTNQLRWQSDVIADEIRYWEKVQAEQAAPLSGTQKQIYEKLKSDYSELKSNPEKDIFVESNAILFTDRDMPIMIIDENSKPGQPMLRQMTNKDLNYFLNTQK